MKGNEKLKLLIGVCLALIFIIVVSVSVHIYKKNTFEKLIIISIDGLAGRFVTQANMPKLTLLLEKGTFSREMSPPFPSKTFTSHQTIATGLYAESHGIIDNNFKSMDENAETFTKSSTEEKWWNFDGKIRPIYIANEMAGWGRISATVNWPGSNVIYSGRTISRFETDYVKGESGQIRLDKVKELVNSNDPNLIMAYLDDFDLVAHTYGPDSPEAMRVLHQIDDWIDTLFNNLLESTRNTVMLVSDHGFRKLDPSKNKDFAQIVPPAEAEIIADGANLLITPANCYNCPSVKLDSDKIVKKINGVPNRRWEAFIREDFPVQYHYQNNDRISPIIVQFDVGYYYETKTTPRLGGHGWAADQDPKMLGFFLAIGKKFRPNHNVGKIKTVDLYKVFCDVLEVQHSCNPSNFTVANVQRILQK